MAARVNSSQKAKKPSKPKLKRLQKKADSHKIYRNRKVFRAVTRAIWWLALAVIALLVIIFFLFKSWTVYSADGLI
jgi:cell division protein FtsL